MLFSSKVWEKHKKCPHHFPLLLSTWICLRWFFNRFYNGKSPLNQDLGTYFWNFFQASNQQIQVPLPFQDVYFVYFVSSKTMVHWYQRWTITGVLLGFVGGETRFSFHQTALKMDASSRKSWFVVDSLCMAWLEKNKRSLASQILLLMEEIPHHLLYLWNLMKNVIFPISTGAGFLPSTVRSEELKGQH